VSSKVFDELKCPDCGGRIGLANELQTAGVKPCTCFELKPEKKRPIQDEPDPVDMKPLADPNKKLCRVCGKNLAGRSRLKDEKGYICKKCSDAEFEADAEAERDAIDCPECHRKLKPEAFVEYRGTLICKRCHAGHLDNDKLKVAKLGELKLHNVEERRSVARMSIIVGVALFLALLVKTFAIGW
jgi:DNA-directed RNA polymerase subunit RPC12/RpoP